VTPNAELEFRSAALRLGFWIGWAAILAVAAGLSLDVGSKHRLLLLAVVVTAGVGNAAAMRVPWRRWLESRRGRLLLDGWTVALLAFIATLVLEGGASFTLLVFLAVPFIAVVQIGRRRILWLAVSATTCALTASLIPLPAGATAMRLGLLAAATAAALVVTEMLQREARARARAAARAELEHTLATEAHHRIKNSLQTVADLLLLEPPDESVLRVRSIATLHDLLAREDGGQVRADALLAKIAEDSHAQVSVAADPVVLQPAVAHKLGLVANELIVNAVRHGAEPIDVRLSRGAEVELTVENAGDLAARSEGLGLDLVRRLVEQGLGGTFELRSGSRGVRAEVVVPG
jgi:two-component sensor histidine kinase